MILSASRKVRRLPRRRIAQHARRSQENHCFYPFGLSRPYLLIDNVTEQARFSVDVSV